MLIKYYRAWTLPAQKYWKATTVNMPAKEILENYKILKMILQVPACLLISKFWLDDIVGELMLDGKMQQSVPCRSTFQHRIKKRESFIRLKKIIPRIVLGNGDWLWPTLPGAHHMPHFVNKVEKQFKFVRMSPFFMMIM